jgi:hypothetical protein
MSLLSLHFLWNLYAVSKADSHSLHKQDATFSLVIHWNRFSSILIDKTLKIQDNLKIGD